MATRSEDGGDAAKPGGGLHLFVTPAGGRSWRYEYRFGGIETRIVFGGHREANLERARELLTSVPSIGAMWASPSHAAE